MTELQHGHVRVLQYLSDLPFRFVEPYTATLDDSQDVPIQTQTLFNC